MLANSLNRPNSLFYTSNPLFELEFELSYMVNVPKRYHNKFIGTEYIVFILIHSFIHLRGREQDPNC